MPNSFKLLYYSPSILYAILQQTEATVTGSQGADIEE